MKKTISFVLVLFLSALLCIACSKEEEDLAEKTPSKVDEITTEASDAMVKKIRTPIDKARMTQNLGDKRMEEVDQAVQNQ